jgi:hypothetical protein
MPPDDGGIIFRYFLKKYLLSSGGQLNVSNPSMRGFNKRSVLASGLKLEKLDYFCFQPLINPFTSFKIQLISKWEDKKQS